MCMGKLIDKLIKDIDIEDRFEKFRLSCFTYKNREKPFLGM